VPCREIRGVAVADRVVDSGKKTTASGVLPDSGVGHPELLASLPSPLSLLSLVACVACCRGGGGKAEWG